MSGNTFGTVFTVTTFGESHGAALGAVLQGVPAGLRIDEAFIQSELDRRRPGSGIPGATARREADRVKILSGVFRGKATGTPIAFLIENTNQHSRDYDELAECFRPGHADFTYQAKYGIRDYRGGGRASARETASRVVAGAIAKQLLREQGITVKAELVQVGAATEQPLMTEEIRKAQAEHDSVGGIIRCTVSGVPAGWGEPIFDKVQARLAYAMLSINACKGFEYGVGFDSVNHRGSEINHLSGGIAGGITDGTDITFRVVFKPTPSIGIPGRHDACVAVRAVPVVEAMAAMVICDYLVKS